MAHFQCEKCSTIVSQDEQPERCESCGAPAGEAYPHGSVDESTPRPVDHLFDLPAQSDDRWNPAGQTTLELDEKDLETSEPPPLAAVSTLELNEADLEASQPPPSPPGSSSEPDGASEPKPSITSLESMKSLVGRVAYPLPTAEDYEEEPYTPVEVDEMAASGLPPVPPRPRRALASQTQSLKGLRARRSRRQVKRVLVVVGSLLVAGAAVALLVLVPWMGQQPGAPDAGSVAVDLSPADLPRPDLSAPDVQTPDLAAPDRRRRPVRVSAAKRHTPAKLPKQEPATPQPQAGGKTAQELYKEGLRLLFSGSLDPAIVKFNQALGRDPIFSLAYRGLGVAYQKQGRNALAREAFKRYLRLRPGAPDTEAIRKRMTGGQ